MQLRPSERKRAKIKMALQGSAGSGKTYSSLLLAQGLTNGDFSKVAIIDTENGSADLYAHLGNYNVLSMQPPFSPQKYVQAIEVCEKAGMEVIILDSISHCWDYLLDYHSSLAGNSFTNWAKIKPLEKLFIDKILQSNAHVIATMRTKQDYVLNQKDGKFIPEKVGLKAVQRDGLDFEFTLVFDVDIKHFAVASKDRTEIFMDKPEFIITSETGKKILDWCNSGKQEVPSGSKELSEQEVYQEIQMCNSLSELLALYQKYPHYQKNLKPDFEAKKSLLIQLTNPQNFSQNGHAKHH
ncbi:AAA family ATPase [Riemerella anatipestifer]|uniref:AAA family ATPase n=1 Tax=Riemerella anatipestifer TaxID=34085 RepID=A0AAP6HCB6_RIEAN|nr:AAA family ATPase [Riemerella anatipestifer]MBT0548914.1 AAA family ATPase [Riemerella anatipestifer]MBT0555228.1 AAA family ATPase [Riemerella anatipestifer]MBT0559677.1 AAA family ATPase [Riemerella anatipestifer]MCD5969479.1 ATP-binding protein [Riemerella anatipestifer]MCO7354747.1 ATP-binding protein [Riemerella anatipestifer]